MPVPAAIQELERYRSTAASARLPYEKEWWLNLAFFRNRQYSEWQSSTNSIREIPRTKSTKNSPRPVVNKINHFVMQQHSFALQNKPVPDVLPANDTTEAASQAQIALAYCNYSISPQVTNYQTKQSDAVLWALVCGPAYQKWCWDPKRNKPEFITCSPFEIYLDPFASSFAEVRYLVHSKFVDKDYIHDKYGKEIKGGSSTPDATKTQLLREMGAASAVEGMVLNELWMKPSRRHPNGRYAVWCGQDLLIEPQDLPYAALREAHKLPFTQLIALPIPGSPYADSRVTYLRSPQMEMNKYHAQRIQIRNNYANPKWWIPDEVELQEDPDDTPNQILRGNSDTGARPEIIQAAAMADNNEGEWLADEMMNVVGLHEVSQGQVPGRVESSKAIELLRESDATLLKPLTDSLTNSLSDGFWITVMLAREFGPEKTIVQAYSPEGAAEVREFRARDIDPGLQFVVTMGTGLAWSRAARTDQLLRLYELGIFQSDPERFLELLDVPSPVMLSSKSNDVRLARNENYEFQRGTAITANSWDDHEIHLREHNNYRKTQDYVTLATDHKQRMEMHCQQHQDLQVKEFERQSQLQSLLQPAPPGTTSTETSGQTGPGEASAQTPVDPSAPEPTP